MKRWHMALLCGVVLALGASQVAITDEVAGDAVDAGAASKTLREGGEKFTFQAEVNRLMDIIIHSLYSNKDIFLRELISNASDALDKIRLLALQDPKVLGEGDAANLEIRIDIDKENNVLRLRDRGVGMSKKELIDNLGTVAKSGTSAFLEKMQQGGDVNLIGQFGVGFYSVYLVADYVEVISKSNDDIQYIWESKADGSFAISEDPNGELSGEGDLERGTLIRIHLKEQNQEYAQEYRIKELVKKYSEFISFPIYMQSTKEVEVEDDEEETADDEDDDEEEAEEDSDKDSAIEDEEDEEAAEGDAAPKKKTEMRTEWEVLNSQKALWLRSPRDVEQDEYDKFFAALSKDDTAKPMAHSHFRAEGDVEFRSILYIPAKAPFGFYDNYYTRKPAVKLYVRRVFISDEFEDLLPRYLSFLLGLVDSDTLPLNVSREMLQQHASLKTIKKKLVRKALEMMKSLSEAEAKAKKALAEKDEEKDDGEEEKSVEELKKDISNYETFWTEFGKALKLGVVEDASNRLRLAKLLRFHTSQSVDKLTSLDEYLARMKEGQKNIFYICGQSLEEVRRSPFLEKLIEQGTEVIYFTEPMDEYMMQNLIDYEDVRFQNAAKEDLKLSDDESDKKKQKQLRATFQPLTKWWRKLLGEDGNLEAVRVSNRLAGTPCVVVTSKYGWSSNMQRIMQAQALGDAQRQAYMMGKRTLEINPRHPLVVELLEKVNADPEDEGAKFSAQLLYETGLLESGYPMEDNKAFATKVYELMRQRLGMERNLDDLHPEPEYVEEEEEEEAEAAPEVSVQSEDAPPEVLEAVRRATEPGGIADPAKFKKKKAADADDEHDEL